MEKFFTKMPVIVLSALIATAMWGSGFALIKLGYDAYGIAGNDSFSQSLFAGIRFLFSGTLILAFSGVYSRKIVLPGRSSAAWILCFGFLTVALKYFCTYMGLGNVPGGKSSILDQSGVFLIVLSSGLFFKNEKLTLFKIIGCVLGFAGVIAANFSKGMDFTFSLSGEAVLVFASVFSASGNMVAKKGYETMDPIPLVAYGHLFGGLCLLLYGLAGGGRMSVKPGNVWILAVLTMTAAVPYVLWNLLQKYNSISKIAVFRFCIPLFGVVVSALLLGESVWKIQNLIALLLIGTGIWVVNKK